MGNIVKGYENIKKDSGKRFLFVIIYFLSLFFIIFAPLVSKLMVIISILMFACSLCFLPTIYSYSLLFGLFPFANIFKISPDSISLLTLCEIMLLAKIALETLVKNKSIKCNTGLLFGLVFMTSYIILFSTQIDYLSVVKLLVRIMLVAYYMRSNISYEGGLSAIKVTAYSFSFSMLLMMILSQISSYTDLLIDYLRVVKYRLDSDEIRNCGLMDDPNYCSLAIMVSITFISVLYYYKKVNFKYWILVVPLFLLGFTTYSKSYFLTAVAFLILLLLFVLFPKHKGWALVLSMILVIVVFAVYSGQIEIINKVLFRFENGDITTGRDKLNQQYFNYIFKNIKVLFFGEGFDIRILPGGKTSVHNLYIEILFRLGIIGGSLFAFTVLKCFPQKTSKTGFVNYIPVIFIAVMYLALGGIDSYGLFYYILLAGISIFHIKDAVDSKKIKCI